MNVLSLYWHRYLRITPLLAVTILVTMSLFRFIGSGPFWPYLIWFLVGHCEEHWWSTLLHIQNYENKAGTVRFEIFSDLQKTYFYSDLSFFSHVAPRSIRRSKCCKYIHFLSHKNSSNQKTNLHFPDI